VRLNFSTRSTVVRLLVRTWNLFHGNTVPPGRQAFLDKMVRLASADGPDAILLQELPVWALAKVGDWSGMTAVVDVAQRPMLGPLPSSATLGRLLTSIDHGLLRSAFTGQGNAILLGPSLRPIEHRHVVLNSFAFRRYQAGRLGLGPVARLAWSKERRVCQAVRVGYDGDTVLIGNLHATGYRPDRRIADAELLRAATFVDGMARPGEPVVLGGDFNVSVATSGTLAQLTGPEWGFSGTTPGGIDHLLVRGLSAGPPARWPAERRRSGAVLLSDHAPVEREVG
jgi:endonuclease/exonuclease/phosphatase family metal-dependent hydrolase